MNEASAQEDISSVASKHNSSAAKPAAGYSEFKQRVEQMIDQTREACRSAKNEADLNKTLLDLSRLQGELNSQPSPDEKLQGLVMRLGLTAETVSSYQDMLAFRAAGYEKQAKELHDKVTEFIDQRANFTGARNVHAVLNDDGSMDITWENIPGNDEDMPIQYKNQDGEWETIATVPAGTTSYHQPPDPPPASDKKERRNSK